MNPSDSNQPNPNVPTPQSPSVGNPITPPTPQAGGQPLDNSATAYTPQPAVSNPIPTPVAQTPTYSPGVSTVTQPMATPTAAPIASSSTPQNPTPTQPVGYHFEGQPSLTPSNDHRNMMSLISTILLFVMAPVIAILITTFAFQSYQVDGESMETTLQDHDRLIVNKIPRTIAKIDKKPYIPKRGQIIIFEQDGITNSSGVTEKQLIKRVIGLPGDRVVVKDGKITIFNSENPSGYDPDKAGIYDISSDNTIGNVDIVVKSGQVFVCGDNRDNSLDSRVFGPINVDHIIGKLSLRILPVKGIEKF